MLKWLQDRLSRRQGIAIWVIKQLDDTTLHLCGSGMAEGTERMSRRRRALAQGTFVGPVRIGEHHEVLHSDLFARLPLHKELCLIDEREAEYAGRRYHVSWVPERCWRFQGRLISQPQRNDGALRFVSHEDVAAIRQKAVAPDATATPPRRSDGWSLTERDAD
ncbi:hypothetical protein C8E00_103216 [Chromohalobacter marismortui]|uniref:Uncharacterized protein n=1 Tax=Chromohalobacter marismortui TaxID=42055 RepID=A0A4R7NPM2_9GAMM|nr:MULTISPECIES: hypothetical protein [Chromohalobacter]MCI0508779.1 hypothetical protein [Chromohalobacter sp.]MCI0594576.1 hypothetical protein [Chromohalobacter sp.]TDU22854.1 hypothetical protein C8E00_103216 [Chromohalobacter marismortui]